MEVLETCIKVIDLLEPYPRGGKISLFGGGVGKAEKFTGIPGVYVPLKDTLESFGAIVDGELGIWAHHSSVLAAVVPGTLRFRVPGQAEQLAAVSTGMVKAEANEVLVLVDSAERPEEIDEHRARREALLQKKSRQEYQLASATLARALNRLRVKPRSVQ